MKRKYNKDTGRSYIYDTKYQSSPDQRRKRSLRNKARRIILASLSKKHGKSKAHAMMRGKDVDHIKTLKSNGSNKRSNLRLIPKSKNRARK